MAAGSSAEYARDFNSAIDRYQKRIDEELFGNWLNTTAVSLNATMVDFYDEIEKGRLIYFDLVWIVESS